MTAHPVSTTPRTRPGRALGAGLFLPPIAVLANIEIGYALVPAACSAQSALPLHLVNAVCLALAIAGGLIARRILKAVGIGWEEEDGSPPARTHFLAGVAVLLSGISALVIVAQWMAVFLLDPCQ